MFVREEAIDRDYFRQRAIEERRLADACMEPTAALAHFKLAVEYEKRARLALVDA